MSQATLTLETGPLDRRFVRDCLRRTAAKEPRVEWTEAKGWFTSRFTVSGPVGAVAGLRELFLDAERMLT